VILPTGSTARIYNRDFYVPVIFMMSPGPTVFASHMNPGFVEGGFIT
jgi:hypothetical protein